MEPRDGLKRSLIVSGGTRDRFNDLSAKIGAGERVGLRVALRWLASR